MRSVYSILLLSIGQTAITGFCFVATKRSTTPPPQTQLQVFVFPTEASNGMSIAITTMATASSWWVATIDSDIAKIPDNEFAPVFFGGMAVMLGGVLSAAFVGTVVDQRNLYGQIVADSYIQGSGGNEQDFWKSLSPEETIQVRDLLERMKEGKDGKQELEEFMAQKMAALAKDGDSSSSSSSSSSSAVRNNVESSKQSKASSATTPQKQNEIDMFSDYAE